ncbi:MAG TPA: helix-turn-helix domain-containing protein [Moheibacter sp.]|nr:helix-turn-helix domain-containing protein [Moheibacter sp.]
MATKIERPKLDWETVKKETHSANDLLNKEYGKPGTPTREQFNAEALAYYYGELIKETRKEKNLTQQELADLVGKERAYIAKIERGQTDLQISNFIQIISALGLSLQIK